MTPSQRVWDAPRFLRTAGAFVLGSFLASCGTFRAQNYLSHHVVPVSKNGALGEFAFKEPKGRSGRAIVRGANLTEHTRMVLAHSRTETDRRLVEAGQPRGRPIPLMVAIHGGRNTPGSAARRDDELLRVLDLEDLGSAEMPWMYPVFVDWRSGDFSTVWGRLWNLRQGRDLEGFGSWLPFPIILANEIARGLVRLPRSLAYGLVRDLSVATRVATGWSPVRSWGDAERIAEAMKTEEGAPSEGAFDLRSANYSRTRLVHGLRLVAYFPTQLTKIPLQALVLEGLGQGAWDVMRRRASHLVRTPLTYELKTKGRSPEELREFYGTGKVDGAPAGDGALPILYDAMASSGDRYELTIVAHSMGAMAINESLPGLSQAIEESDGRIDVQRIIYMAPACSVIEAASTLVPFLKAHDQIQFHLLMLHPIAEADEFNAFDLVPRGSLLEWIDVYYGQQATHGERVFGKWANAVPAVGLFESVRGQVHFKAFDVDGGSYPQKHGQFFEIPFWRPSAYETAGSAYFESNWLGQECGRLEQRCLDEEKQSRPW